MRRLRPAAASRRPAARRLRASRVVPTLACGALVAALALGLSPLGRPYLQPAVDTALRGTALIGLAVAEIEVEGRETTDRDTILDALGAGIGTPILAVSPKRAKEQLEKLPWVRSAIIERRLPDTIYVRLVERKLSLIHI